MIFNKFFLPLLLYAFRLNQKCVHTISIEAKWQSKVDGALCATMIEMKSYNQTVSAEPAVSKHFTQNVKQQCAIWNMVGYLRRKFKCQNVCARRQILSTHQKRNRSITLWDVIINKVPLKGKSPFAALTCSKLNRHQVTSNNHNSTTARLTLIRSKCDCVCVCIRVGSFTRWVVLGGMRLCGIDFLYNSVIQWHMILFMVSIVLKSSQSLWLSHSKKS